MKRKKEQKPILTNWENSSFNYDLTLLLLGIGTIALMLFLFLHKCDFL